MFEKALAAVSEFLLPGGCCCAAEDEGLGEGVDPAVLADHDERGKLELDGDAASSETPPRLAAARNGEAAAALGPSGAAAGRPAPAELACPALGPVSACSLEAPPEENDEAQVLALRAHVRDFVLDLVKGMALSVVVEAGRTEGCRLSLSTTFTHFRLEAGGTGYDIPIRTVKRACPGPLASGVGAPAHLDELCNTLILSNGECVTFRFSDLRKRDEFTKCINLLVTCTDV